MENRIKKQLRTVVLDYHGLNPGDLEDYTFLELTQAIVYPYTPSDLLIERSLEAEVLVVNKVKLNAAVLSELPNLKAVIVTATGYDNIDVNYLDKHGIFWSNIEDYSTPSVVQHTFALILAVLNRSTLYSAEVTQGHWSNQPNFAYWNHPIRELNAKVLGLIGYGNIAKEVAKVAVAFGMKVIVNHTSPLSKYPDGIKYVDQDELLQESDIVSLHLPSTPETAGMVNRIFLEKMQEHAILINTARGSLVSEKELVKALEENLIAYAALDVLSEEPPKLDHPLLDVKNCLITPHQAWASVEARQRLLDKVINVYRKIKKL